MFRNVTFLSPRSIFPMREETALKALNMLILSLLYREVRDSLVAGMIVPSAFSF